MADESGDVEMGYVDDDIELDDINVDDELISLNTTSGKAAGSSSKQPVSSRHATMHSGSSVAQPGDLYLRPANRATRRVLLAKFMPPDDPHLIGVNKLRLYRHGEGTLKGRERGLKKHREQLAYFNSYVGKRRTIQKQNVGAMNVPERNKKSWYMEVTPSNTEFVEPPRIDPDDKEAMNDPTKCYAEGVEAYNSAYEGGYESAKYALLVANADGKHVDVVPVGDQAWFRFRSIRGTLSDMNTTTTCSTSGVVDGEGENENDNNNNVKMDTKMGGEEASKKAERLMRKKTGTKLFERFKERTALAAERREANQGGYNARAEERQNISAIGIRRKVSAKIEAEKNAKGETEFEAEFDNDDVDQIDRDDKPKLDTLSRLRKSAQQVKREEAARVRLIKDESLQSLHSGSNSNSNSNSNSDEEHGDSDGETMNMNKVNISAAIQRAKSRGSSPAPLTAAPVVVTRNKGEVTKELLPRGTELIGEEHVRKVIIALTTERGKAKTQLKELLAQFEELRKSADRQQKALMKAVKAIGEISKVNEGGKACYYVALKR